MDVYIPLANRFGIAKIKWELEDLCLKHLHNKDYYEIKDLLDEKKQERDDALQRILKPMREMLEVAGIKAKVSGRSKHFYSIFCKNVIRKVPYTEIFDLVALRIIVNSVEECYEVLEALESGSPEDVCDELGDVLFQIVFLASIFDEAGDFNIGDVVQAITEKMIRRHPHVFGQVQVSSSDEVKKLWQEIKMAEARDKGTA